MPRDRPRQPRRQQPVEGLETHQEEQLIQALPAPATAQSAPAPLPADPEDDGYEMDDIRQATDSNLNEVLASLLQKNVPPSQENQLQKCLRGAHGTGAG